MNYPGIRMRTQVIDRLRKLSRKGLQKASRNNHLSGWDGCSVGGVLRMAPRPYWKGYLKLSLVSCPIALSPATSSSAKISFRQVNKETGNRIRYKKVDSETEEEVPSDQIGKGYEVGKNEYLIMDDEELEAVELESTHTIDIDQF